MPMVAASGTGKTTTANNLNLWQPSNYAPSLNYSMAVTFENLVQQVGDHAVRLPADTQLIVPVVIDQREAVPPSAEELSAIKRFLRHQMGARVLVMWLETDQMLASQMSDEFQTLAGLQPLELPTVIRGPEPATWPDIANNTLRYSNDVDDLSLLGVDPETYRPNAYSNIGSYLSAISNDFGTLLDTLLADTQQPIRLNILFATESQSATVLTELTYRGEFGLLDASALLAATPSSDVGNYWRDRRGPLQQTIMRLEARAFNFSPSVSAPAIALFGEPTILRQVASLSSSYTKGDLAQRLERSDIGRYLLGQGRAASEGRGTPATSSVEVHKRLAELGFGGGRDKTLNRAIGAAFSYFLQEKSPMSWTIKTETVLPFADIIPDVWLAGPDGLTTFELTWRAGDYLSSTRRGAVANYVLTKLKNYAIALGWVPG